MDEQEEQTEAPEATWPGVDVAYDLTKLSYSWILQRLDAVDSRIQTLQAFAATITLAALVIAASVIDDVDFESVWFVLAVVAFVAVVAIGSIAGASGRILLISPQILYDKWLHYSEWEFKKNAVYFAGQHFKENSSLVNGKGRAVGFMTALFLAETAFLLIWVARQI